MRRQQLEQRLGEEWQGEREGGEKERQGEREKCVCVRERERERKEREEANLVNVLIVVRVQLLDGHVVALHAVLEILPLFIAVLLAFISLQQGKGLGVTPMVLLLLLQLLLIQQCLLLLLLLLLYILYYAKTNTRISCESKRMSCSAPSHPRVAGLAVLVRRRCWHGRRRRAAGRRRGGALLARILAVLRRRVVIGGLPSRLLVGEG